MVCAMLKQPTTTKREPVRSIGVGTKATMYERDNNKEVQAESESNYTYCFYFSKEKNT